MTPKIELQEETVNNFWQDSEYSSVNVLAFMVHYWVIFILSSFQYLEWIQGFAGKMAFELTFLYPR